MKFQYKFNHNGKLEQFFNEDRMALLHQVETFYKVNDLPYVKDHLLKSIDRQSKYKIQKTAPRKKGLIEIIQGAKAIIKFAAGDCASHSEIQRRSKICENCPMRQATAGCSACGAADKVRKFISEIQKTKKTVLDIPKPVQSKFCEICGCSIALMVVTKYQDFKPESNDLNSRRPDFCWLKKTSPNFTQE